MHLRQIVRASKSDINVGNWHTGKVPRGDFPLAKKAYRLGKSFEWCVISFRALDADFRVLVIRNDSKQKYEAVLGMMAQRELRVLCSYEYHAAEPGWHCHAACDDTSQVPTGIMRGPWVLRLPSAKNHHRRQHYEIQDRRAAIRFAIERYQIEPKGPLL